MQEIANSSENMAKIVMELRALLQNFTLENDRCCYGLNNSMAISIFVL